MSGSLFSHFGKRAAKVLQTQKYDLDDASEDISLLISNLNLFAGTAIPIDPLDSGEAALANRRYFDTATLQAQTIINKLQEAQVKDILSIIRAQGLLIERLENNDLMLLGLIENIIDERKSIGAQIADFGASTLKGVAHALWAVPGLGAGFGAAAYGGGMLLDWYSASISRSRLLDDLAITRNLVLDNSVTSALHDRMDHALANLDDPDSRIERMTEWISHIEEDLYKIEVKTLEGGSVRHAIKFFESLAYPESMGIVMPLKANGGSTLAASVFDFTNNSVQTFSLPGDDMRAVTSMDAYMDYALRGNARARSHCVSVIPYMSTDEILQDRVNSLSGFVSRLAGPCDLKRTLVHSYLQSGSNG